MSALARGYKPPGVQRVGGYELDAFVVQFEPATGAFDFSFRLGASVATLAASPAAPNERLRLFLVNGPFELEEPSLLDDPFCFALPRFEWKGELLRLPGNRRLVAVAFEAALEPARYRCELSVLGEAGHDELVVLSWQRELRAGLEGLGDWLALVRQNGRFPAGEGKRFVAEAAALRAAGQLDDDQHAALWAVVNAVSEGGDPKRAWVAAEVAARALGLPPLAPT